MTCCNVLLESREDSGVDDNNAGEEDEDEIDRKTSELVLEVRSRALGGDGVLETFDAE